MPGLRARTSSQHFMLRARREIRETSFHLAHVWTWNFGNVNHLPTTGSANTDEIINRHPEIFEERMGQFKVYDVKLHIDSSVT